MGVFLGLGFRGFIGDLITGCRPVTLRIRLLLVGFSEGRIGVLSFGAFLIELKLGRLLDCFFDLYEFDDGR